RARARRQARPQAWPARAPSCRSRALRARRGSARARARSPAPRPTARPDARAIAWARPPWPHGISSTPRRRGSYRPPVIDRAGELAALATAACWVATAICFERAGKRIGSLSLNLIRLVMALVPLSLWGLISRGHALPLDADAAAWGWLSLSSLIGLVIGDLCLFRAFVLIGPRLSSLLMAWVPVWTALFGFAILGETLGVRGLLGIALTVGAIG